MNRIHLFLPVVLVTLLSITSWAQSDSVSATPTTTVRGCLSRSRGNYLVVEDKTGLVYALKGVGTKLNGQIGHEVEVAGQLQRGTVKTGVRSAKDGSNPSDTIHGVDGTPLQVNDVNADVRMISKHCRAADAN